MRLMVNLLFQTLEIIFQIQPESDCATSVCLALLPPQFMFSKESSCLGVSWDIVGNDKLIIKLISAGNRNPLHGQIQLLSQLFR